MPDELGAIDLGDAPTRDAAHAEGDIKRERTSGDGFSSHGVSLTEAHDGAIAVAFEDVADGFI